jgi:NAD(P)-dependent dehydrogenase (short-subunit alcohol dehydrogenase family)
MTENRPRLSSRRLTLSRPRSGPSRPRLLGAVEETSAEHVKSLFETNVFGLLNVTRAVLPHMRSRRQGHIMNISSVAGYSGYAGFGVYSGTKFAVEGLSEALHLELALLGVHVTIVEPGFFRSDILDHGKSLIESDIRFADYDATAGAVRAIVPGLSHNQPGDSVKLAYALLELANAPNPPLRLSLGPDTLQRIAEKDAVVQRERERHGVPYPDRPSTRADVWLT